MTHGSFNRIPAQCDGICELTQANVNKHGIVLTRNCDGPSVKDNSESEKSIRMEQGEVVAISPEIQSTSGRVACTNAGFNAWLTAKEEIFNEGAGV